MSAENVQLDLEGVEESIPLNHQEIQEKDPVDEDLELRRETLCFRDGVRQIDFVIAYVIDKKEDEKKKLRRETFEANMMSEGLELEYEDEKPEEGEKLSQDGNTVFIKIHAPWDVLTHMAELMAIKMPIKDPKDGNREYEDLFKRNSTFSCIPNPFEISEDIIKDEPDYFTADFNRERESMFIIEDKNTFFRRSQRIMIVSELLTRIKFDNDNAEKIGVRHLVDNGTYSAAYPLHDGPYWSEHSILASGALNDRHLLYETWARPGRWYNEQPLDQIRNYFGEKVGIYFAWLGFYTYMLVPASIVGVIVFLYGCITLFDNVPSEEICDVTGAGNITMCPLCDARCTYWKLNISCLYARLTYLFDNPATVFFAGFMAIWSTMFLELWQRQQAEIQYDWDVAKFEFEEHVRPEFEAKVKHRKLNPVTMLMEPFLPLYSKAPRKCVSCVVVIFMICCVIAAVFGVIMYRIIIVTLLYSSEEDIIRKNAKLTTSATAACINLVAIMILNKLYLFIAVALTDLERPRTDSEYENSFTFKMFLFQFINYYSSIFYIAFFKGRYRGHPGSDEYKLFGTWNLDECDPAGCLIELCIQLAIVMVGKQALNNFKELVIPMVTTWYKSRGNMKEETEDNLYTRWEQDNDLSPEPVLGLFDEYLEMVVQYGFVTIFVAAFPLAPLFALINNVIEIRLDAFKMITQIRRPVPQRAQDIGMWLPILKGVTFIAVLSNAFIIGWTSDFIPKLVYNFAVSENNTLNGYINNSLSYFDVSDFKNESVPNDLQVDVFGEVRICRYNDYRYPPWADNSYEYTSLFWHIFTARLAFIIIFEHAVFFLTWLVQILVPDVPANVKQLMLREIHIAKEARYDAAFSDIRIKRSESRQDHIDEMDNHRKTE